MADRYEIEKELQSGGEWLGAARTWIQWNIPFGDTLQWRSLQEVKISVRKLEEFALTVAVADVKKERESQCTMKKE